MDTHLSRNSEAESNDLIQTTSYATFKQQVLRGSGPIAVEFMSYSCSHCGTLEPILQQVAEMLASKVKIFRVNIATDEDLAAAYQIEATPTLILFLNGRPVGRIEGPTPKVSSLLTAMAQPFRGTV